MNIYKDEYLTLSWTFHIWIIDEDEIVKATHKTISACPFFIVHDLCWLLKVRYVMNF